MLRNKAPLQIVVRRQAAIGDVIASTAVADKLSERGYEVGFQVAPLIQPLLRYVPNVSFLANPNTLPQVNLDGAYEDSPDRTRRHFSDFFVSTANFQLRSHGITLGPPTNCRPCLVVPEEEKSAYRKQLERYQKPWVFIVPRSNSWANRTIQPYLWREIASRIKGTCFWTGMDVAEKPFIDVQIRDIIRLIRFLACADLLVSVDTGPLHMAAALGVPCVALEQASSPELHLSDQRDFIVIRHPELKCLNCQKNVCPIDSYLPPCQKWPPELVAEVVNKRLRVQTHNEVSAVIPIFRPPLDRLKQCLDCVLPQVSEVIVTCDAGGRVPPGAPLDPKIRYVQHRNHDLGFGKNVNFGFRHSNARHVLVLNDDVYLWGGAVENLKAASGPEVGIVGHQLWYPNGKIQHGGKFRNPGMRGWGHIDHLAAKPTITAPMECENVTGASILVNRQAFYDAGGFDEDFFMYAEDDAFCLQVRQAGYKVVYTPLAGGTHLESQSAGERNKLHQLIDPSNRLFDQKWGWWIEENLNTVPGIF